MGGYRAPDWFWREPDPWWLIVLWLVSALILGALGVLGLMHFGPEFMTMMRGA